MNMDIETAFQKYINSSKAKMLKTSTRSTYTRKYERYLLVFFKNNKLNQIVVDDFAQWILHKVSDKTASDVLSLLKNILSFSNIFVQIYKPKVYKKKINIMSDKDIRILTKYCIEHLDFITYCILLTYFTGVRIGEICACKVEDLDLKNGYLKINKTIQRVKNLDECCCKTKIIVDNPKSPHSNREIPLILELLTLGKKLFSTLPLNAYLATGSTKYYEPRSLEYHYKKVISKAKVEYKNFHALRHKFATDFYYQTYDIKTLAELLGHSNASKAIEYYVHSDVDKTRDAIDKMSNRRLS